MVRHIGNHHTLCMEELLDEVGYCDNPVLLASTAGERLHRTGHEKFTIMTTRLQSTQYWGIRGQWLHCLWWLMTLQVGMFGLGVHSRPLEGCHSGLRRLHWCSLLTIGRKDGILGFNYRVRWFRWKHHIEDIHYAAKITFCGSYWETECPFQSLCSCSVSSWARSHAIS